MIASTMREIRSVEDFVSAPSLLFWVTLLQILPTHSARWIKTKADFEEREREKKESNIS